jgi:hypothetical protein
MIMLPYLIQSDLSGISSFEVTTEHNIQILRGNHALFNGVAPRFFCVRFLLKTNSGDEAS